jgi:hypothetical protein
LKIGKRTGNEGKNRPDIQRSACSLSPIENGEEGRGEGGKIDPKSIETHTIIQCPSRNPILLFPFRQKSPLTRPSLSRKRENRWINTI